MKCSKYLFGNLAILLTLAVSAQEGASGKSNKRRVFATVYSSYGILAPGSFKGSSYLFSGVPVRFQVPKNAMGNGIYFGAGFGVILNETLNLGINGEYLSGNKIQIKTSGDYNSGEYSVTGNRTYGYSIASILPNIVFKSTFTRSFYMYTRLGLQIGIPLKLTESYYSHFKFHKDTADPHAVEDADYLSTSTGKYILKPTLGYQIAAGVQVLLSKKLRISFEISTNRISYNRERYEDMERLDMRKTKNKDEPQLPVLYDRTRYNIVYINKGSAETTVRGVANNYVITNRSAQKPVIVNSINAGMGLSYIF